MKTKILGLVAMAMLAAPLAASAATVTQVIHFDDANNGWKWYSDTDLNFLFNPTNLQSSVLCADSVNGGNGSCVIESQQGILPMMTRPQFGPQSQGDANAPPVVSGTDQAFTLNSFYFLLTGKGEGAENAITVTGSNGNSYTFMLGGTYAPNPAVTIYEGLNAGDPAGPLVKNTGYIASFGDLFTNVAWIQFSAPTTAQVRLDCVVATFNGTTSEPLSSFTTGCGPNGGPPPPPPPPPSDAPEPGTLALLGLGLLGLGLSRKVRRT